MAMNVRTHRPTLTWKGKDGRTDIKKKLARSRRIHRPKKHGKERTDAQT